MIHSLKIQNLILISEAEIPFGPGLNILTGETGAGKSAVLAAIALICGERADSGLIRQGSERAVVEAALEGKIIRRELYRSGKSRCFIDDEQVSLTELRQNMSSLVEQIDQKSSRALAEPEEQRKMLDRFAGLSERAELLAQALVIERATEEELRVLLEKAPSQARELRFLKADLEAIEEVNWVPGEEVTLEEELGRLAHSKELAEKLGQVVGALEEPTLKRLTSTLEQCCRFDPKLKVAAEILKSCSLELTEVSSDLASYLSRLDADPGRLQAVEARLHVIESLRRRLGPLKKEDLAVQIAHWESLEEEIEALRTTVEKKKQENQLLAGALFEERTKAAPLFSTQVLGELRSLNLPHAQFQILAQPNAITYLFSANPGHTPIPLQECASGGELSRVLLAVKTILSEKELAQCLVFDEIDSNVGGHTATILGEKLQRLSQKAQVICITHFVQVARFAAHHFLVAKQEALTSVTKLNGAMKELEYGRMLGIEKKTANLHNGTQ